MKYRLRSKSKWQQESKRKIIKKNPWKSKFAQTPAISRPYWTILRYVVHFSNRKCEKFSFENQPFWRTPYTLSIQPQDIHFQSPYSTIFPGFISKFLWHFKKSWRCARPERTPHVSLWTALSNLKMIYGTTTWIKFGFLRTRVLK